MKHKSSITIVFSFITAILLVSFIPLTAYPQEQIAEWACENLELVYSIDGGNVVEICHNPDLVTLIVKVDAISDGQITMDIPRKMVYSLSQGCESQDLILLINDSESINANIVNTPKSRIITLDFPQGQNTIEFIGTYMLDVRIHDYCGVIYGYSSKYLPPLKQINNGITSTGVLCNEGLELILKPTDNSPACVKPVTAEKLIARGWAIS